MDHLLRNHRAEIVVEHPGLLDIMLETEGV
jgi:hypothetical protein